MSFGRAIVTRTFEFFLKTDAWHRDTKDILANKLREEVLPEILQLGFTAHRPNRKRAGGMPTYYWREVDDSYENIELQWDNILRAKFILNVSKQTDSDVITALRKSPYEFTDEIAERMTPPARVAFKRGRGFQDLQVWFGIGGGAVVFVGQAAVERQLEATISVMKIRIEQIDCYFRTGETFKELFFDTPAEPRGQS